MPKKKGDFDQLRYIKEYNEEHIIYRKLSFNIGNQEDMTLLEWLDKQPSKSAYIKELIRQDYNNQKSER